MSLLRKLAHEAFSSHEGVVAKARTQLDGELKKFATGGYEFRLVPLSNLVQSGEALNNSLASLFGKGRLRVDRVLVTSVPTQQGRLDVAVPFSGKDTLAPQFSMTLPVSAPAGVVLSRSAMGSWGFGNWVAGPGFGAHPATEEFCQLLEKSQVPVGLEWNFELAADYIVKLPWTLQVVPLGEGQTKVVMQSGRQGVFFQRFGVDVFLKKVSELAGLLATPSPHPAASGGQAEASWFELISQMPAPTSGWVAPDAAPAPSHLDGTSRPMAGGPVSAAQGFGQPVPAGASAVHSRAMWAVILSGISLPLCCLPLGLVGGGLALSARSEAAKQGIDAPGTTTAALIMGGLSSFCFIALLVIGALAPKPPNDAAPAPVVSASAAGSRLQVPLGGDGEAPPGLPFEITKVYADHAPSQQAPFHAAGGDWTYFDAMIDGDPDCTFSVGVAPSQAKGGFGFGKVQLSVKDRVAAECLVDSLALGLETDIPEDRDGVVGGPLELATAVLGQNVERSEGGGFGGEGTWTATKLFLEKGDTYGEVFFNYDLDAGLGEFSQKDSEYDPGVVAVLASELRDAPKKGAVKPAKRKRR